MVPKREVVSRDRGCRWGVMAVEKKDSHYGDRWLMLLLLPYVVYLMVRGDEYQVGGNLVFVGSVSKGMIDAKNEEPLSLLIKRGITLR